MSQDVSQKPVEIFISYSRKDRRYAEELKKHLRIEECTGRIRVWYDADLTPGRDWEAEIYSSFCSSSIILMLVSPDFFASDYCTQREMPAALQRHQNDDAIVVPVIVRPVAWQRTQLAKLMVLPKNGKPVAQWETEDHFFQDVTTSLFEVIDGLDRASDDTDVNPWVSPAKPEQAPIVEPPRSARDEIEPGPSSTLKPKAKTDAATATAPSSGGTEQTSRETKRSSVETAPAKVLTVVVCFVHSERRHKLQRLRKWCRDEQSPPLDDHTVTVVEKTVGDAVQLLNDEPASTVVVLDGFEPGSAQLDGVLASDQLGRPQSVIFNSPEWDPQFSSSSERECATVTDDQTLLPTLREALLNKCETPEDDEARHSEQVEAKSASDAFSKSRAARPAPAGSSGEFRRAVTSSRLDVVVCFAHPELRQKLQPLRKWSRDTNEPLFADQEIRITACNNLKEATPLFENPDGTLLLLDGFTPGSPELDEVAESIPKLRLSNVVVNVSTSDSVEVHEPSASLLQSRPTIATNETLFPTLRKAVLRVRMRQFAAARVLDTPEELAAFFELRYRVWSDLDYLSEQKKCPETPWELDYTDRTSLPIGIFSNQDGRLLGGARLVRALGKEYLGLIQTVEAMLRERDADRLEKNFQYPQCAAHPFDILGELDRFKEYYRDLVLRRIPKAEISRVVVASEYRKLGLGEVIVDSLCSLARINSIRVLFLACHTKHADFYQRSQFEVVPGVSGEKFLTYKVPCIAMDRTL